MSTEKPSAEELPEENLEMSSPVATKVFELLSPVVATADVELLDVEWTGGTLPVSYTHLTLPTICSV